MNEDAHDRYNSGVDEWRQLPVFKQGVVILKLVEHIIEGINLNDPYASTHYKTALYERYTYQMMENSLLIPSAIASSHSADLYDLKMENAVIVRKAANEIISDSRGLLASGYKEIEYLDLLCDAVDILRPLFAKWIQTFDTNQYIIDRWGLFNPPGISFDDKENSITSKASAFLRELDDDWDENLDDEELI